MIYTNYLPFSSSTNYSNVLITTNQMFSDLLESVGCCADKQSDAILIQSDLFLTGAEVDFISGDTARYQDNIKAAYLILYNYVSQ